MTVAAPVHFYNEFPQASMAEIFELLEQTAKNLRSIQRQTVSEVGLTPPQYGVLHLLWDQDERPFKEFAEALLCTRATITGIIDTLERKGFVIRKPNPTDRRSVLAKLTDEGRELQRTTPSLVKVYDECCSGLAPLEFQQLGWLLRKLNDSIEYGGR